MNRIMDLKAKASEAVEKNVDRLYLSIPEPKKHNGHRVRLFGNRGPLAVIINGDHGRLTVHVNARKVLKYIDDVQQQEVTA